MAVHVKKTPAQLDKLCRRELIDEVKRLQFTVSSRGHRIGSLYAVVQSFMDGSRQVVQIAPTPADQTLVQSLKSQLDQSHQTIVRLMKEKQESQATSSSESSKEEIAVRDDAVAKSDCVLCFESFSYDDDSKKPVCISCGHIFCQGCILKSQENKTEPTCPLCRAKFKSFTILYFA